MKKIIVIFSICLLFAGGINAQDIKLPAPQTTGGMPLMEALSKRQTTRTFSNRDVDRQTLSNLLWSANGFNRPDRRTAPTARDRQELELYVALSTGLYWYDAKAHTLVQKSKKDIRALTGQQDFVGVAPVNIVIVGDTKKQDVEKYYYLDCGYVSQNIYLFCASAGLITVARGLFDAPALSKALELPRTHAIVLTQTVGYSK